MKVKPSKIMKVVFTAGIIGGAIQHTIWVFSPKPKPKQQIIAGVDVASLFTEVAPKTPLNNPKDPLRLVPITTEQTNRFNQALTNPADSLHQQAIKDTTKFILYLAQQIGHPVSSEYAQNVAQCLSNPYCPHYPYDVLWVQDLVGRFIKPKQQDSVPKLFSNLKQLAQKTWEKIILLAQIQTLLIHLYRQLQVRLPTI